MTVVPTHRTRVIADRLVRVSRETSGADAVLRLLPHVEPDQVPALIGVLLTQAKPRQRSGRRLLPLVFTERERLDGNARYKKGHRDELTMAQWREYQRVNQRRRTERVGRAGR